TTPLVLVGLGWLIWEGVASARHTGVSGRGGLLAILAAYAVLFGFAMTFAGKSFDRYLLPAFPAIDLLAGFGLALVARRVGGRGAAGAVRGGRWRAAAGGG